MLCPYCKKCTYFKIIAFAFHIKSPSSYLNEHPFYQIVNFQQNYSGFMTVPFYICHGKDWEGLENLDHDMDTPLVFLGVYFQIYEFSCFTWWHSIHKKIMNEYNVICVESTYAHRSKKNKSITTVQLEGIQFGFSTWIMISFGHAMVN